MSPEERLSKSFRNFAVAVASRSLWKGEIVVAVLSARTFIPIHSFDFDRCEDWRKLLGYLTYFLDEAGLDEFVHGLEAKNIRVAVSAGVR